LIEPAMPLFWKPYTSDVSQLVAELKAKKPTLEAEQRAGRALLWDKNLDRQQQAQWQQARVPQQPYVYQNKG
jgi:hypothetical protein